MRENLLKKQPTWGLRRAQGTGQKSATPATLTKVILVLLTMFLLPSAAWGETVTVTKTITFDQEGDGNPVSGSDINNSTIPVSVSEEINGTTYSYNSLVNINNSGAIEQYSWSNAGAVFRVYNNATTELPDYFAIDIPGKYPQVPTKVEMKFKYDKAISDPEDPDDEYSAIIQVGDYPLKDGRDLRYKKDKASSSDNYLSTPLTFNGNASNGEWGTDREEEDGPKSLWISISLDGNYNAETEDDQATFTITEIKITYDTDFYLSVAGIPVTGVNVNEANDILGDSKVSFTPAEGDTHATLTLSNANLEITTDGGAAIESSLDNLVVNLVGENNIITSSASTSYAFKGNGSNNTITFQTDDVQNPGKIQGIIPKANVFNNITPSYQGLDLAGDDQGFTIGVIEYGLTIGETDVTSLNAEDILGNGKVSFKSADESTNTPAKLTLNGATISNIVSNLEGNLDILISGENQLNLISSTVNTVKLHITTIENLSDVTSLSLVAPDGETNSVIYGFQDFTTDLTSYSVNSEDGSPESPITVTYDTNGHALKTGDANTNAVVFSNITYYGITIGDVAVTSANLNTETGAISGLNNVFFSPAPVTQSTAPATLTLNGATINGKIEWNSSDNLTIALNGMNSIVNNQQEVLFISENTCTLNIVKADNAESATLKFASYSGSGNEITNASDYFSGFICSSVLNNFTVQVEGINYNYYTTAEVYPVTVAGRQVHNITGEPGYKDDILGDGKVKFDGSSSTLTLDNAKISVTTLEGYGIETSLEEALTIDLKGTNSITSSGYSFYGTGTSTINITSTYTPAGTLALNSNTGLAKYVTVSSTLYDDVESINWDSGKNALIAKGFTGLTIAGTPITSDNIGTNGVISGVSGITSGTVSFAEAQSDPETPATLTLDNASITGDIKFNASLTVHLVGDNTITKPEDASGSYAFDLGGGYYYLNFSTDKTELGTLKIVGSYSGLQNHGIVYNGQIEGGSSTIGTTGDAVIWKQTFSTTGVTPSYFILSLNKHYNLWKNGHQYHDLILDNNDGFVFDPEESTLTISSSSSSDYINSGLENLTIIVNGTQSMSYIAFGAPEDTQAEGITTGTLTITGKEDSESSSSINSLLLSNTGGGVITGFSSVDLTLPMHVSSPENFTGWTASVTSATITDETYYPSWRFENGQSYATYCDPSADIYLPSTITPSVITEISGSTVKTQALSYIPKGVPVLLSKTNNTATTATFSKNLLKYVESSENPVTASESKVLYVLYNDQFVKVTPGSEIYYGGYLDLTGVSLPANTRGLTIDGGDEGTTALREVKSEGVKGEKWDDGEWYTLQGRKFTTKPTKPGLYILNGRKVVIK